MKYGTDPTAADTDGDGLLDASELETGTDPLDPHDPTIEATSIPSVSEFSLWIGFLLALCMIWLRKWN